MQAHAEHQQHYTDFRELGGNIDVCNKAGSGGGHDYPG